MSSLLLLWLVTGGAVSLTIMMHFWLPDPPPPNVFTRFIELVDILSTARLPPRYLGFWHRLREESSSPASWRPSFRAEVTQFAEVLMLNAGEPKSPP